MAAHRELRSLVVSAVGPCTASLSRLGHQAIPEVHSSWTRNACHRDRSILEPRAAAMALHLYLGGRPVSLRTACGEARPFSQEGRFAGPERVVGPAPAEMLHFLVCPMLTTVRHNGVCHALAAVTNSVVPNLAVREQACDDSGRPFPSARRAAGVDVPGDVVIPAGDCFLFVDATVVGQVQSAVQDATRVRAGLPVTLDGVRDANRAKASGRGATVQRAGAEFRSMATSVFGAPDETTRASVARWANVVSSHTDVPPAYREDSVATRLLTAVVWAIAAATARFALSFARGRGHGSTPFAASDPLHAAAGLLAPCPTIRRALRLPETEMCPAHGPNLVVPAPPTPGHHVRGGVLNNSPPETPVSVSLPDRDDSSARGCSDGEAQPAAVPPSRHSRRRLPPAFDLDNLIQEGCRRVGDSITADRLDAERTADPRGRISRSIRDAWSAQHAPSGPDNSSDDSAANSVHAVDTTAAIPAPTRFVAAGSESRTRNFRSRTRAPPPPDHNDPLRRNSQETGSCHPSSSVRLHVVRRGGLGDLVDDSSRADLAAQVAPSDPPVDSQRGLGASVPANCAAGVTTGPPVRLLDAGVGRSVSGPADPPNASSASARVEVVIQAGLRTAAEPRDVPLRGPVQQVPHAQPVAVALARSCRRRALARGGGGKRSIAGT